MEHIPVAGSQLPATWHWSLAVHVTGFDPVHAPAWHAYNVLHLLLPVHAVPSGAPGFEQAPIVGSQLPATWHWSLAVHITGFEPVHEPLWHVSVCVQELPSLHAVPLAAEGLEHIPLVGSQAPAIWH